MKIRLRNDIRYDKMNHPCFSDKDVMDVIILFKKFSPGTGRYYVSVKSVWYSVVV